MIELLPVIVLVAHLAGHTQHDVQTKGLPFIPANQTECVEIGEAVSAAWKMEDSAIEVVTYSCTVYQVENGVPAELPEGHPPVEESKHVPTGDEA